MDFTPPFGRWLKARRKQLDLTQAALAQRAHYSTIAIQKAEAGQTASRALATALATALDIPQTERAAFLAFARGLQLRQPLNHLPLPATAMLGRETDLATLKALLAPAGSERLVTLLGPPESTLALFLDSSPEKSIRPRKLRTKFSSWFWENCRIHSIKFCDDAKYFSLSLGK